jgi:hypothetical protein
MPSLSTSHHNPDLGFLLSSFCGLCERLILSLDILPKLSQITAQRWGIVQRQDDGFWPR